MLVSVRVCVCWCDISLIRHLFLFFRGTRVAVLKWQIAGDVLIDVFLLSRKLALTVLWEGVAESVEISETTRNMSICQLSRRNPN